MADEEGQKNSFAITLGRDICKTHIGEDALTFKSQTVLNIPNGELMSTQYHYKVSLHQACEEGKLDLVRFMLSHDLVDINSRGKLGRMPIMIAAGNRQVAVFDFLITQNCDLFAVDDYNDTVLHVACAGGNTDIVKKLLDTGKIEKESRGHSRYTPLMKAVYHGHIDMATLLMNNNCSLKVTGHAGENLLHVACFGGHVGMVEFIISQKIVSVRSKDSKGRTPLMITVSYGHRGAFDLLLCRGSNLKTVDVRKNNILHAASFACKTEILKYILSLDIFPADCRNSFEWTPLLLASFKGCREGFDLLVSKGCNVTSIDNVGCNIFYTACREGRVDMVKYILSLHKLHIYSRGYLGSTPAMAAAARGYRGVFKLLVSKGCDLKAVDKRGDNILHVACQSGHVVIVKDILSLKAVDIDSRGYFGRTLVMAAASAAYIGVFKLLVSKGCDLKAVDKRGDNILHVACQSGHVVIVKDILSLKAVDIDSRGYIGRTPAMAAASAAYKGVFKLLVSKGCDLKAVGKRGDNILHVACQSGHVVIVKDILSLKAVDIDSRGYLGRTPVMAAAELGHKSTVALLISNGCNMKISDNGKGTILHQDVEDMNRKKNIYGRAAKQEAKVKGHREVVSLLEEWNRSGRSDPSQLV